METVSGFPHSVLSGEGIRRAREAGLVVIDPFRQERVQTSSYDVGLGEHFWVTPAEHPGIRLINPFNPDHIRKLWNGPWRASTIRWHLEEGPFKDYAVEKDFNGLDLDDRVIILRPNETILAHTEEFIGGKDLITTTMQARSTWGRVFLSVCGDAGWGDVGFINRWTMEIHNKLSQEWIVLCVGQPIAQIVFFAVSPEETTQYYVKGSYQQGKTLEEVKASWGPENMLPRLKKI
ncbi:hypothetical protein HY387_00330 [Candidatus Daviesbacteria bacterium]|nr:hypothetical protein [Candidatus Daviesbacteria bacterium]